MARPATPLLNRDAIVTHALKIIDAGGVTSLSMRKLAAQLGVSGPSLYHHFASKNEILDAIIEQVYGQIHLDAEADTGWESVLVSYAHQLRALLMAHPLVVESVVLRPVTKGACLRIYEHLAAQLSACGWKPQFAGQVIVAVEDLVFGAALMASAPDIQLNGGQEASYPALSRLLSDLPPDSPQDGFEVGLSVLIAGLRQLLNERSDPESTGAIVKTLDRGNCSVDVNISKPKSTS